ncbi:MAG: hypothetical protein PHN88_12190 [Ignavibacteria bacterium]|nr:hypothetical protein [Ignavibacteria bacterium]
MEISNLIGVVQLVVSFVQLKLDHFPDKKTKGQSLAKSKMTIYEKAMKSLDKALAETIKIIKDDEKRTPNAELSKLWRNASDSLLKSKMDIP